jgi:hypothetical protein
MQGRCRLEQMMDIFALSAVAAAMVASGMERRAARTAGFVGLADHRSPYYPQSARLARGRTVPHRIDNDRNPRYVVALREKKAA